MSDTLGPLALTLEEAMRMIAFKRLNELREAHGSYADVQLEITEDGWWVFLNDGGAGTRDKIREFDSWVEAASFALGRPVVARDDAAELRAELLEWKRHAYDRGEENALLYNENGILRALAIKYLNLYLEDFYIEEWTDKWPQDLYDDCVFLNQLPDDGALERDDG